MERREKINLESDDGYIELAKLIKDDMIIEASDFINKFNYLPNVLIAMEDIEKRGQKNYLEILIGKTDHLFRALIISKLCKDPKFIVGQDRFDHLILQPKYTKWHQYYLKLKEKLEQIEPIYNN